jgi:rare lipoprotein A
MEHHKHAKPKPLPASGQASIYADSFEGKETANHETFRQDGYTAALLPRDRWHAVPLGTRVELTHGDNHVVVEINDRGAGDRKPQSTRALDLSRAAGSALTGQHINDDKDAKRLGLIKLDKIRVVPADTPLGPVRP